RASAAPGTGSSPRYTTPSRSISSASYRSRSGFTAGAEPAPPGTVRLRVAWRWPASGGRWPGYAGRSGRTTDPGRSGRNRSPDRSGRPWRTRDGPSGVGPTGTGPGPASRGWTPCPAPESWPGSAAGPLGADGPCAGTPWPGTGGRTLRRVPAASGRSRFPSLFLYKGRVPTVRPFIGLLYDVAEAGPASKVTAPPYDTI